MKHTFKTPAERLPPVTRMAIWSDSFFSTEAEAVEEVTLRLSGKNKCDCECGGYPRGTARFLPGHEPQQEAQ